MGHNVFGVLLGHVEAEDGPRPARLMRADGRQQHHVRDDGGAEPEPADEMETQQECERDLRFGDVVFT